MTNRKKITIVTPCYNEEDNVQLCYDAVVKLFDNELKDYDREHLFCDNASTDKTAQLLRDLASKDKNVKVILNANNFGFFRSMFNGTINATGDAVVPLLPADLQDPPELIPEFVKNWEEGYKVVYGVRHFREEGFFKKYLRKFYYRFITKLAKIHIPVDAGEFGIIDRQVVEAVKEFDDYHPYLRGIIAACGFKSKGIKYTWVARKKGKSKIGLLSMFDQGLNGMVWSTDFPIRLGMMLGFSLSFISFLYIFFYFILFISGQTAETGSGINTLIVSLFFFSGVQLFFISLIGEYVSSIHSQVRKGPLVVEALRINFDDDNKAKSVTARKARATTKAKTASKSTRAATSKTNVKANKK